MFAPTVVTVAEQPPFHCILTGAIDGPFVDCGVQVESLPMQNPRAYLSEVSAFQVGKAIGMVTADEHAKSVARVAQLEQELNDRETELNRLSEEADAIAALTRNDYVIRKPPGRPKKKETV